MTTARRSSRSAVLLASLALAFAAIPASVSASGDATFGTGSITSTYGKEIVFEQPVTVTQALGKVELLVTFANAIGPSVTAVPAPNGTGALTLSYRLDTAGDGHILPNTPLLVAWRVRPVGGTAADATTSPVQRYVYGDERFTWKSKTGSIARVHWTEGDDAFGGRALQIAEDAIAKTSKLLGVNETEPVDFYIYADQTSFYDALGPGTRENVGGEAVAEIRTLFALITPSQIHDSWVGVVIPHELTHLVFDTAVHNPYHFPPRWLNEGLAVYESQGYDASDRSDVKAAAKNGGLIPLTGLTAQFPTSADGFGLAYSESVSAVDYVVRTYGQDALIGLISSYAAGRTDDEAFTAAIGLDVEGLSDAWLADVGAAVPERLGPQPAPAGPVPSDWTGGNGAPSGSTAPTTKPSAAVHSSTPGTSGAPASDGSSGGDAAGAAVLVVLGALVFVVVGVVIARRRQRAGAA